MKMNKASAKILWNIILPVALILMVFLLGMSGLQVQRRSAGEAVNTPVNNVHSVLSMFFMNYDGSGDTVPSVIIAKYLAAVFTIYVLLKFAHTFCKAVVFFVKGRSENSILVVGSNPFADAFTDSLKKAKRNVLGYEWSEFPVRGKIVLFGTDEENRRYLQEHSLLQENDSARKPRIYVRSSETNGVLSRNGGIVFFSPEEIAARKYWKQYPAVPEAMLTRGTCLSEKTISISIIGQGNLLQEVLLFGIQSNIYGTHFRVNYHIFGNNQDFEATHRHSEELGFTYHYGNWWENPDGMECLRNSDRILILDSDQPYRAFSNLMLIASAVPEVHIFTADSPEKEQTADDLSEDLWKRMIEDNRGGFYPGKLVLYDWVRESCNADLLDDNQIWDAMGCNEVYRVLTHQPTGQGTWDSLSSYHKYANLFSVDLALKYQKLIFENQSAGTLNENYLEQYARLEHLRWCNYHWFFNWSQAPASATAPSNKTFSGRLHNDLVDFDALTKSEAAKDLNSVRWLQIRDCIQARDIRELNDAVRKACGEELHKGR